MIRIVIFFILFFTLSSYMLKHSITQYYKFSTTESVTADRILWSSSTKLKWEDFRGVPDPLSKYRAMTFSKIDLKHELFNDRIVLEMSSSFNCLLSWSKNMKSNNLLEHEQLHFDITELAARKIRKECSQHISYNLSVSSNFIQVTYDYYDGHYRDSINAKYDMETGHGIITSKQKEWEINIAKELKELEAYTSPNVTIVRK